MICGCAHTFSRHSSRGCFCHRVLLPLSTMRTGECPDMSTEPQLERSNQKSGAGRMQAVVCKWRNSFKNAWFPPPPSGVRERHFLAQVSKPPKLWILWAGQQTKGRGNEGYSWPDTLGAKQTPEALPASQGLILFPCAENVDPELSLFAKVRLLTIWSGFQAIVKTNHGLA